ncbi:MAG: cytochrome-c oxidase, cbb3-type subunit I [Bacteroidia bacterium]
MQNTIYYDNRIVRNFAWATVLWGIVGMLVGVLIAVQLFMPEANLNTPYTTYGRIRPLHTNAVIFAFVGNAIFMGVYYSLQRLLKARMWSDALSQINFWGWQLIIVAAALTLPLGYTSSKEYAELEWPIDIAITIIWVVFGLNLIMTILNRREKHMYVAIWFYIATFVTVAVLHIVNSFELPLTLFKSYSYYAGVQDALVQWWYGHNAVAFFLTTPYLGLMYYFLPKVAQRPVYSYRLSIIHFWSLIFIYIWAGPHHLLYSSLPEWAQSLGVVFSIMLIAPSWGGMINGLLTLRGVWDKVREDPVLKMMVVAITGYGMATFEGPMHSLKSVNALSHFTDWIPADVHVGTLAWNGMFTFAVLYYIIPKIFRTELYSLRLANAHFWLSTIGLVFWVVAMYWSGITQGLMWKQFTSEGTLQYPNFLETVIQIIPMYMVRALGGGIYLVGALIMAYNLIRTAASGHLVSNEPAIVPDRNPNAHETASWHRRLEGKPALFSILVTLAILIGGIVEFLPTFLVKSNIPTLSSVKPYTPLELHGRDVYIKEGCVGCHSQMIRPFRSETERYGEYSKAGEFIYDHPFLWGSKRTGPDLHRVGGKYPDSWHYNHMMVPERMSPGSIMPAYPWLAENLIDTSLTKDMVSAMRTLGVPYAKQTTADASALLDQQAAQITERLKKDGIIAHNHSEMVALIAYLQRLGIDIRQSTTSQINTP